MRVREKCRCGAEFEAEGEMMEPVLRHYEAWLELHKPHADATF